MYKRIKAAVLAVILAVSALACGRKITLETAADYSGGEAPVPETDGAPESGEALPLQESEDGRMLLVHVCGAVRTPGVYELPEGSRVYQAVEMAGGMTEEAASDYLNLADVLTDGAKVAVPRLSEVAAGELHGPAPEAEGDDLVDLNRAGKEALMELPGIGEAKAEAILAYREEHGAFGSPEDIMQVPGIKEAAYGKIKDKITVR